MPTPTGSGDDAEPQAARPVARSAAEPAQAARASAEQGGAAGGRARRMSFTATQAEVQSGGGIGASTEQLASLLVRPRPRVCLCTMRMWY